MSANLYSLLGILWIPLIGARLPLAAPNLHSPTSRTSLAFQYARKGDKGGREQNSVDARTGRKRHHREHFTEKVGRMTPGKYKNIPVGGHRAELSGKQRICRKPVKAKFSHHRTRSTMGLPHTRTVRLGQQGRSDGKETERRKTSKQVYPNNPRTASLEMHYLRRRKHARVTSRVVSLTITGSNCQHPVGITKTSPRQRKEAGQRIHHHQQKE